MTQAPPDLGAAATLRDALRTLDSELGPRRARLRAARPAGRGGRDGAVTDPNGSGKSTLLALLIGRLEPIEGRTMRMARARIGYLPQDTGPDVGQGQAGGEGASDAAGEPTLHLDLPAIERLQEALAAWPGTVVLVSHDRVFRDGVASRAHALADLDSGGGGA